MERIKCAKLSIVGLLVGLGREYRGGCEKFDILYIIQRDQPRGLVVRVSDY